MDKSSNEGISKGWFTLLSPHLAGIQWSVRCQNQSLDLDFLAKDTGSHGQLNVSQ